MKSAASFPHGACWPGTRCQAATPLPAQLGPLESVVGCWMGGYGDDWTSQAAYAVVEDQETRATRIVRIDVEHQTPEMRAQFAMHNAAFQALRAEVQRVVR